MLRKLSTILILTLVLIFSSNVNAQVTNEELIDRNTGLPFGVNEQISIDVSPKVPKPGEQVNVSIESFSSNLSESVITWSINGSVVKEGRGEIRFSFNAPEVGNKSTLNIRIAKPGGGVLNRSLTIQPANVSLIYETDTYTHPFYKGKSLYTNRANIKVVAFPDFINTAGSKVPTESLLYTWEKDNQVVQDASGYGKNVFKMQGALIDRPTTISVTVKAVNSDLASKNSILLFTVDPQVLIYENNPLHGVIFEQALVRETILDRDEITIKAIPYFFSADETRDTYLNYVWKLNNKTVNDISNQSEIIFRKSAGQKGISNVSLSVNHLQNFLQTSRANFNLRLSETENSNTEDFQF